MRDHQLIPGQFYHVFNRGVNRMRIFHNENDFSRFYQSLYLFNDANHRHDGDPLQKDVLLAANEVLSMDRDPLVKIISFCLLPNHFHLFLEPLKADGAARFFQKVCQGYARYYNLRYQRTGPLFEGRFRAVPIEDEAQFLHVPRYIHLNALDGQGMSWRDGEMNDWAKAAERLDAYRWSSHSVFMGRGQELPVVDEQSARSFFPTPAEYETFLQAWTGRFVYRPAFDRSLP